MRDRSNIIDLGLDEGPIDEVSDLVGDARSDLVLVSTPPQELILFRHFGGESKSQVLALLRELGGRPRDIGPRIGEDVLEDTREDVASRSS